MKKLVVTLLAATLMLALGAGAAQAQGGAGTVSGKAVRWNGSPIAGATMRALGGPLETDKEIARTTTGADGSYALTVPAGTPYWIHIDTFGTWWGYSYQVPFTLRPGEVLAQVYFALGPRDVKEIVLPSPVSNVAPATGSNRPAPAAPAAAPAPAQPAPAAPISNVKPAIGYNNVPAAHVSAPQAAPISNVKPAIGYNNVPAAHVSAPRAAPQQTVQRAPGALPATGANTLGTLWAALAGALLLAGSGLAVRRFSFARR